ncbi:MAG: sel1 repeat family protein, partial [Pseudomonadota bacterium]
MKQMILPLMLTATPIWAEDLSQYGTTNPDEMTWQRFVEEAEDGKTGMVLCSMGYALTKSGDHDAARTLFLNC